MHPLFTFYSFGYKPVQNNPDKYNVSFKLHRPVGSNFKQPYKLVFTFSDKAKAILQKPTLTVNPADGWTNVEVKKVVSINYPKIINCDKLTHSTFGTALNE